MWLVVLVAILIALFLLGLALAKANYSTRGRRVVAAGVLLLLGAALIAWGTLAAASEPSPSTEVPRSVLAMFGVFLIAMGALAVYGGWTTLRRGRQ